MGLIYREYRFGSVGQLQGEVMVEWCNESNFWNLWQWFIWKLTELMVFFCKQQSSAEGKELSKVNRWSAEKTKKSVMGKIFSRYTYKTGLSFQIRRGENQFYVDRKIKLLKFTGSFTSGYSFGPGIIIKYFIRANSSRWGRFQNNW